MFKNPYIQNTFSMLAVAVFGFVLLNLTFLFYYSWMLLFGLFVTDKFASSNPWYPWVEYGLFLVIIGLISWLILRSRLRTLFKAIYLTVPLAVIFVTIGIFLKQWPVAIYLLGGLFTISILFYLFRSRKLWIYYFTTTLVALVFLAVSLFGVEI